MREKRTVYVGAGNWGGDTGKIQVFELDVSAGTLALTQEIAAGGVAAFMVRSRDGRALYVADESKGLLSSYAIAPENGHLRLRNQVPAAGHPVYVTLDGAGSALLTCFFEEARTEVIAIEPDGALGASTCLVDSGAESHCTVFDPSHRYLFVPTRGDNWIAQYRYEPEARRLVPNDPPRVIETPGAGPRHLVFHPNGRFAYLVNELALTLSVYALDAERGTLKAVQQGLVAKPPDVAGGAAADIQVHPNGQFLYLSNRQQENSNIAIFSLDPVSGRATVVGHELTRGRTPRNFMLDPTGEVLIVGNLESNDVALFRIAAGGARLDYVRSYAVAPGPFCVRVY